MFRNSKTKPKDPLTPAEVAGKLPIQDLALCAARHLTTLELSRDEQDQREWKQWQRQVVRNPCDAYQEAFNDGKAEGLEEGLEQAREELNVDFTNQEAHIAHCILTLWNGLHTPQEFAQRVMRELKRRYPTLNG